MLTAAQAYLWLWGAGRVRCAKLHHHNGYRCIFTELLQFDLPEAITQLEIEVCHFPSGTSKWNKIEHRLFCHITRNWQGQPLDEV